MSKKRWRILVPMHESLVPPDTTEGLTDAEIQPWKMEYDLLRTLEGMGHEVRAVGVYGDVEVLGRAIREFRPHVAFNLAEEFHGNAIYHPYVAGYLELKKLPYTGCNPRGMILADDKALSKKILAYHGIAVPEFVVFPLNRVTHRPRSVPFPLFVKSLTDDGSVGISQASIVHNDEQLLERVEYVQRLTEAPVIAEQYIEGREIYVGVLGNTRLQTFTPWELILSNLPEGAPNIATDKVKWNYDYQEKLGVKTQAAEMTERQVSKLTRISRRIYRHLGLSGYARLDFRVDAKDNCYLLEANPNPNLSYGEDYAEAAEHSGIDYEPLLQKILTLGHAYHPWK